MVIIGTFTALNFAQNYSLDVPCQTISAGYRTFSERTSTLLHTKDLIFRNTLCALMSFFAKLHKIAFPTRDIITSDQRKRTLITPITLKHASLCSTTRKLNLI